MQLIGSANADVGMDVAWETLLADASAMDAVEAGIRVVEDNAQDHTVGYGGYPNIRGKVELDASIMEGTHRKAGAVGALRGYRAAVTVARAVLERLPHVLVVGEGASLLAEEIGLPQEELLTPEAQATWRGGVERVQGDLGNLTTIAAVHQVIGEIFDPEAPPKAGEPQLAPGGTVNLIAVDRAGRIASAVSTSGWAWKYPGRLGDTPVIGAGNYCDDRYGAAACTGWGELTIRAGTARSVVAGLASGLPLEDACRAAMRDLVGLEADEPGSRGYVNLVAVDRRGKHFAMTTKPGTEYVWRAEHMAGARRELRQLVDARADS